MFSYLKSLLAFALAILAVIGSGLWCQSRLLALRELTKAQNDLQAQLAGQRSDACILADYERRLETLDGRIKVITGKFVGWAYEVPQLVKSLVKSASDAGMKMTHASQVERKPYTLPVKGNQEQVCVIAHDITVRGSYPGLVKFMQSLTTWEIGYKVESVEIVPCKEGTEEGEVEVSLILSVYSLEKLPGPAPAS